MKYLALAALLALTGCDDMVQSAIDDADMICRDNVEYMVYSKLSSNGSLSYSVVPHFKPDGSLYTCKKVIKK
ncbi:MAG: hypothetical protein EOO61_03270 [Hymenobacter sp.]|nr:MAG: hypothetical protein EOO61_03270 [Hymenobacter sp.]